MGYSGIYFSDHLFNPRDLKSRYTYSKAPDGAPFWEKETEWPDPMCLISALATVTTNVTFTTGVYIAPVRDLITVAKSVGTAAVLSHDRVRLGVGVGWCEEEFVQTGQDFHTRGKRLNDMIPALRALWQGGWVEYHGSHYDVPPCQMNPSPTLPVPILGGGDSEAGAACGPPPCATDGSTPGPPLPTRPSSRWGRSRRPQAGRAGQRAVLDLPGREGLPRPRPVPAARGCRRHRPPVRAVDGGRGRRGRDTPESIHAARVAMCEQFAENIIAAMA